MASIAKPSGAPALWPYAALALLLLVLLGAILALNGGTFTYSLDDSYIHLAFSEQLAQGNFGLVAQQPASPSSSVLYPLLLLPLAGTALHPFQPLLWAAAAVFAALALWRYLLGHLVLEGLTDGRLLSGIFALLAVVSLNHAGLAFSGMESALQITLSLATTIGLIELLFGRKLRWWLVLGIIVGPLIRYENLALSLPAILIVIAYGRWQIAALCALVIAAALGGYAAYCLSIGLPALPGSLLLKTGLGDPSVGLFWGIARQLRHLYEVAIGGRSDLPILMLMGLLVLNFAFCSPGPMRRRERVLIGSALFVMAVQFIFGGHGSLGRYDVYAWSSGLAVAAFVNRSALRNAVNAFGWRRCAIGGAALLLCLFPYYAFMAVATPVAANDIYIQQFQMRRFIVDFARGTAVVNDAGLAAYRNPYGIVDLTGLGSEEIRRLRLAGQYDAAALQRIAQAHGAKLALVYMSWLGNQLPAQWVEIAQLDIRRPTITVGGKSVSIYALNAADAEALRAKLQAFAATLPRGAYLEIKPTP